MKKLLLSIFLFSCSLIFAKENSVQLKPRYPHWRAKVAEYSKEGAPSKVFLYDGDTVVKQLTYYPTGEIKSECDIAVVSESSKGFEIWKSQFVPDGWLVSFFPSGEIEQTIPYDHGVLHGQMEIFNLEGELRVANFHQGVRHGSSILYYKEGSKAEEVHYKEGKIVGDLVRYYPKEVRSSLIPYQEGQPHGTAYEWYPNRAVKSVKQYRSGQLHSEGKNPAVVVYDENHDIIEIQDFVMGKAVGSHIKYHSGLKKSYQVAYQEGKKHGKEEFFSSTGVLIGEGEYIQGVPVGLHWKNHPNGKRGIIAEYDRKGNLLSPIINLNEEGQKIAEYFLKDGLREGSYREWSSTGEPLVEYNYTKGVFDGAQTTYYPGKVLKTRGFYREGKLDGTFEEWLENGSPKLEEHLVLGKYEGLQRYWHNNGKLQLEARYLKGVKEGLHREWNTQGELIMEMHFKDDQPEGLVRFFYGKDKLRETVRFINGKREGLSEEYYPNGKIKVRAFYKEGELDGSVESWYEEGAIQFTRSYKLGIPIGEHKEYYPSGQLARHFQFELDGSLKNEQCTYYPDGAPQTIISYRCGELHGRKAMWDAEGGLLEEAFYEDGLLNGRYFEKTKDGKEIIYHYKNNKREGKHEIYYPPHPFFGKVKALEVNFIADKPEGEATEYNEAGNKVSTTFYRAGHKEGIATVFHENGNVCMVAEFKNNKCEGPVIQYFPSKKIFKEMTFINDLKEGEERTYFEQGGLAAIAHYKKGKKQGLYQEWNQDKVLIFEGEYREDLRHGKFNKYYDDGRPKLMQFFTDDQLNGVKQSYDADGVVTEVFYEMGKKISNKTKG